LTTQEVTCEFCGGQCSCGAAEMGAKLDELYGTIDPLACCNTENSEECEACQ
jgi:hypothetical protein